MRSFNKNELAAVSIISALLFIELFAPPSF